MADEPGKKKDDATPNPDDDKGKGKGKGDDVKKIELTQERIDDLINKAFARGAKNSKDAQEVADMQKELDDLRGMKTWLEEQATAAGDPDKQHGDPNVEAQFQAKLKGVKEEYEKRIKKLEMDQTTKTTELQTRNDELLVSGLKSDVVSGVAGIAADPDEVFTIMHAKGYFHRDEETGKYVVVDPVKKTVQLDVDNDGEPLAPGKAAVTWLDDHPRHKRASGRTGSGQGAGEQVGGEGPSSEIDTKGMKPSEIFAKRHEIVDQLRRG